MNLTMMLFLYDFALPLGGIDAMVAGPATPRPASVRVRASASASATTDDRAELLGEAIWMPPPSATVLEERQNALIRAMETQR